MLSDPHTRLRLAGLVEGTTLLLLIGVAVPLKRLAGWPEGVSVMGPLHGLAFLVYVYALAEAASAGAWPRRDIARAALAPLLPFGTFLNDRWLRRRRPAATLGGT
jgi:integral membrane protein